LAVIATLSPGSTAWSSTTASPAAVKAAGRIGINPTDLNCLNILSLAGQLTPGQLAQATGLTTASITGVADRLEAAGYVRRERDTADRRVCRAIGEQRRRRHRRAAHREHIVERVIGGDLAEHIGVVDEGTEEVDSLHQREVGSDLVNPGVIGLIEADKEIRLADMVAPLLFGGAQCFF